MSTPARIASAIRGSASRLPAALPLYRHLLQAAAGFRDYNFREYALRQVREKFRAHRGESDPSVVQSLLARGAKDLGMLQRQSLINQLYSSGESIIEKSLSQKAAAGISTSSFTLKTSASHPSAFQAWLASAHISGGDAVGAPDLLPADEADVQARKSPQEHKMADPKRTPDATGVMPEN